jgi:exosome complex component RRP4
MESISHNFVLPGQVLATSNSETDGGFLRGHGTYIEIVQDKDVDSRHAIKAWGTPQSNNDNVVMRNHDDDDASNKEDGNETLKTGPQRLVASLAGTVQRVNKLISVIPTSSSVYTGQVGDLIIGRITGVGGSRWKVSLTCSHNGSTREGQLPLSGVNLPGGVQRIRTSEDVLAMRSLYKEGDLVSCEVQNVQRDGTLILHTRSLRYGKLENGVLTTVPPGLVGRRKNHFATIESKVFQKEGDNNSMDVDEDEGDVDVYLGLNGGIWIQRKVPSEWENTQGTDRDSRVPLAETLQKLRMQHASTRVSASMRERIARVRNAVDCLRLVQCQICPESIESVVRASLKADVRVGYMICPEWVVHLTEGTRQ